MDVKKSDIPRKVVLLIDLILVSFSLVVSYLLRFNFDIPSIELKPLPLILAYILFIKFIAFWVGKSYAGMMRYASLHDAARILLANLAAAFIFILTNIFTFFLGPSIFFIPFSIIVIEFLTSTIAMLALRLVAKMTYIELNWREKEMSYVLIFGAGEAGIVTKNALERDSGMRYKILAFFDDNPKKAGKRVEMVPVLETKDLESFIGANKPDLMVLAVQNILPAKKQEVIELCLNHDIKVLNVPPVNQWINGQLSLNQIKTVKIEDLLERDAIKLDEKIVKKELTGKIIMITGAAGSIGSELARQVLKYPVNKVLLFDNAESPLYHLELEFTSKFPNLPYQIILGDIRDRNRLKRIFTEFHPQIVYHAAAYKHVPMMEAYPNEAISVNVVGTKNIADLAVEFSSEKFIMVSSDKAVNPTNVMGASKRIAEIYIQNLNNKNVTKFITTRFGNVLGSNGSVIPLFKSQIEKGGPITVTHPNVTRFFMTIPEACQLVLDAGCIGHGGEIFVFDMGKSVKVVDLAKKMVKLSGLELGKDIQIVFTGLRPGEKLYEELLNNEEDVMPTHHPKILIGKVRSYDSEEVKYSIESLISSLHNGSDETHIVKLMKEIVPEFKSANSKFELLD
jgi:FlaA1/EpsC-like NDP-sugar epimerase